jgi:hypothetical protein
MKWRAQKQEKLREERCREDISIKEIRVIWYKSDIKQRAESAKH